MKLIMRLCLVLVLGFVFNVSTYAQQKEMDSKDKKDPMTWEEAKEAYHLVMAGTFHPAEEGDFKPLREQYKDLIKSAQAWNKMEIPEDLDKEKLKEKLKMLITESKGIGKLVDKSASDETLKTAIFALHDVFHDIVGLCSH